jgi:pullulanase/glycogen debranching enzyme
MWSHYANAHTGICLKFANDDSEPFMGRAQRVNYLPFYQKAHAIYQNPMEQVDRILLSKAKCWAYEAEWRIIDHEFGYGLKYFDPSILTGIVLGYKISESHERSILKWITARKSTVDVYKALRSSDGFCIQICKL